MTAIKHVSTATGRRTGTLGARSAGLRYGALFGPAVFGVTAAGVALPDVAAALDADPPTVAWVLTAHAVALGIGTALFGRLADSRGVRTSLILGSVVLAVGTVLCLVAGNVTTLVIGRFVLAAGSGAMTSGALTLSAAAEPPDRPKVLAVFGATMATFSAGATLAGGLVTQWTSWRLTLVLPALSLLAVPACLREAALQRGTGRRMDLPGAVLVTVAVVSFLVLLQSAALELPAPAMIFLAAALLGSVTALAKKPRTSTAPFLPRQLVTDRTFLWAATTGAGIYGGLFAAMYAVPQLLVGEHAWSVVAVGCWLLPGAAVGAALSRVAGRLTGSRGLVLLATIAAAMAAVMATSTAITGAGPALVGSSLGFAAFATAQVVTTALMAARVEPALRGGAMGLLNLAFFVGGGIGSATAGALVRSLPLTDVLEISAAFPAAAAVAALALRTRQALSETSRS